MNAKEYLKSKGIFSLDTKKRYEEVIVWMEEFAKIKQRNPPEKAWLEDVIDDVVDNHQVLSSSHIANGIIEKWNIRNE